MSIATLSQPLPIAGIRLGATCAGIKYPNRPDLVVMEIAPGSTCAAVFTRKEWSEEKIIAAAFSGYVTGSTPHHTVRGK